MNFNGAFYSLLLICLLFVSSCGTNKNITYLQDIDSTELISQDNSEYDSKILPGDVLGITVSGLDPASVSPFNLPAVSFQTPGDAQFTTAQNLQSYLVDPQGAINFPVLGKLDIGGLTRQECIALLQDKISRYVKDPIVNIQFLNYRVSVLGEVNKPGSYIMPSDRVSIFDAIGMAGDLSIYGMRENVLLIRENFGKKEFYRIDLTNSDLFGEPYYYLKQNDVIYVEPNSSKKKNNRFSQRDSFNLSLFSALVSTASVVVSLLIALLVK